MKLKVIFLVTFSVITLFFSNVAVVRSLDSIDIYEDHDTTYLQSKKEKLLTYAFNSFNKSLSNTTSNLAPVCGDVDNSGSVGIPDIAYLFNYCFLYGSAPPIPTDADLDGYSSITVRDIAYLARYIYYAGPPPNCSPAGPYLPVLESADTISFEPHVLPAFDSTIAVTLNYKNSTPIYALALPLNVTIGDSIPYIDSVVIGSRMSVFTGSATTIDPLQGTVNAGFFGTSSSLSAGSDTMFTLYLSIAPQASVRSIQIDTLQLSPSNYPLFVKPTTLDGVVPELIDFGIPLVPQRNDTLVVTAYSPVDLIVTDPNLDSIGVDFNTIPDATYDTTLDVNEDGENDDIVTIPKPLIGEYTVRVVAEPGSEGGSYTLSVKLDGNEDTPIVNNVSAPGPSEVDTFYYPVFEYLRGDANSDGATTISDVIYTINYLFKGGDPPNPSLLGDANCCMEGDGNCDVVDISVSDVIYLINYLFKGGDAPCS